jgi:hypothetical protein
MGSKSTGHYCRGLYVQRYSNGQIHGVQVVDTAGNENSLDPSIYRARGISPPLEELPDIDDYFLHQNKQP